VNPQRGFAGSGRAEHDDEPLKRAHPENFQYRSNRLSNTCAARMSAPITCVR
jgi:hypothetical protein